MSFKDLEQRKAQLKILRIGSKGVDTGMCERADAEACGMVVLSGEETSRALLKYPSDIPCALPFSGRSLGFEDTDPPFVH